MPVSFINGGKASPTTIALFEEEFGVRLPAAYVELVREHDGALVRNGIFPSSPLPDGRREILSLGILHPFEQQDDLWTMAKANRSLRNLVHGFVVIGDDGGGDEVLLDYRVPTDEPPVYALQHRWGNGRSLVHASGNFAEFLASFIDNEEADRLHEEFQRLAGVHADAGSSTTKPSPASSP